ncbi:MAG: glycoside hydrolase family 43 protein [Sphingomicrobium sp.]
MLRLGTLIVAVLLAVPAMAAHLTAVARFEWFEYRGGDLQPRPGPGEYGNPILQGFYPDPSVVRVGGDYYLVNSTFAWFPGIPVFHSRDLVNWNQIGNAIDRPTQLNFDKMTMWQGVYAPDISWHNGKFYILNTCVGCGGNFVITARNPAGPWSDPVWLPDVNGIDTSLFFDDDGSAWIVHNAPPEGKPRYEGHTAIWLHRFDPKTRRTVGSPRVLVDAGSHPERDPIWIEGPHIFKKNGLYYLIAAEGGTEEGHSEVVFRSDKVTGPYVPFAGNPILTQRDLPKSRPNPITSTGHASFVQTQRGDWWTMFLGVRPYTDNLFNTGRETFLMPVHWKDGWPRVTEPAERVPWVARRPNLAPRPQSAVPTRGSFTVRDEFDRPQLPSYWMMLRNPRGEWWRISGGALEIQAKADAFAEHGNPSLLARRQQHLNAMATTRVNFDPPRDNSEAGLIVLQNDENWYFLGVGREGAQRVIRVRRRGGGQDPAAGVAVASAEIPNGGAIDLRIEAHGGSLDFDWKAGRGTWRKLVAGADGTILSTKKAGGFVGAVFGLYARDGGGAVTP